MILTVLAVRSRVAVVETTPEQPGVPVIVPATTSIAPAPIEQGGTTPVTGSIAVTNGGTGTLADLAVSAVTYQQGSGWLTPTWDAGNTEADWSIDPTGLAEGTYAASFQITSSNAEPVTISATVEIFVAAAGNFPTPAVSLASFATHDADDDNIDGAPYVPEALGYFS